LSDQALFTSGSAELGPQSRRLLRELAVVIAPTGWSMRVEGHTDDRPIRSERYPSNWELSTARAVSVLRFLEGQGVLDRARLAAAGYGEQRPLVPNGGPWQRAKNRRVEILFRQGPAVANVSGENP
jgi:chemotaxis protein MotB